MGTVPVIPGQTQAQRRRRARKNRDFVDTAAKLSHSRRGNYRYIGDIAYVNIDKINQLHGV